MSARPRASTAAAAAAGLVVALALATGCATLGLGDLQPVTFSEAEGRPSTLRLLPPSTTRPSGGLALRLWAEVENPNPFGLTLTDVVGTLHLEGGEGPEADFPLGLPLEARQDTVIPLDLSLSFESLPDLADAVRAAIATGRVDYRLEGSFGLDAGRLGTPRFGPTTLLEGELEVLGRE